MSDTTAQASSNPRPARLTPSGTLRPTHRTAVGAAPVLVGLIAVAVSLFLAWQPALWTDEAVTISAASRSWSSLWSMLGEVDAVHGAYYALMHLWGSVFGYSEAALRLPSAIAVGFATAGLYLAARALDGPRTAFAAAAVFAVLPRTTWMGMEGRSFALSTAVTVALSCALLAGVSRRRRRWFVLYGLLAAIGVILNIYVLLAVVSHGLYILLLPRARRALLAWSAAAAGGVLAGAPVVVAAVRQAGQLGTPDLTLQQLARKVLVDQWFLGETPTNAAVSGSGNGLWQPAAVILAGAAWLLAARALRAPSRPLLAFALPLLLVPTAALVLYSLAASPIYNPRYLSLTVPAMALLIGAGLARLRSPRAVAALGLLCALILPVYLSQRSEGAKDSSDWARAAGYVQAHANPGNGIYFGPRRPPEGPLVDQTQRRISTAYPEAFEGLRDVTVLATGEADGSLDGTSLRLQDSTSRIKDINRILAVRRADYPPELTAAEDRWLVEQGFTAVDAWSGTTNRITVFERKSGGSS
ncbi:glycosyltransferase family 39 protein [Arthrobacter sp. zg-Y1143]|uniref:glycosyltransferase family 39 protein n=1 Tax=Arthrobacter sp. zg-Y1143 TaxID=3049065 RepID=UPI0024C36DBF|nr:glycosyltransferase family 39 protein [Arthrobacter sp. zg-Y1143]MDK1328464.1 glycosyltransferase family 39 protein [Arthrobacter sp. zg-Y1143]